MKAKTKIVLVNGDELRTGYELDEIVGLLAQTHRAQPGSMFGVDTLTGHGTMKRAALLAGTILRVEEL